MLDNLDSVYQEFKDLVKTAVDGRRLDKIRVKFLGKNGLITNEAKKIATIPIESKREFGARVNQIKNDIQKNIQEIKENLEDTLLNERLKTESIDITLPGRSYQRGKLHPISHTINLIKNIFYSMGFEHIDGPDIENEWNNFTALNIPKNHPARQMHDTFYVENSSKGNYEAENEEKLNLLRTHTSTVQIRHMLKNKPPLKIFSVVVYFLTYA